MFLLLALSFSLSFFMFLILEQQKLYQIQQETA